MNAGECKGGARAGRFRPERHQRKARVSSDRWEMLMASMCFTAPAGAPAVPGRRHECGRVQGWCPSRKIPARAPPAEGSRFQ
ncbi:hypothetical protein NDU88_002605 [Pleurodeles waltl]|uniref:Uncharacterized protein n=1 Tax=Pleurodeles waltl TaxID=8319 RepID=A0AAV7TLK5_PLEWA|nr:hypothetical protein NDU88_002605 [Pleurodeles waltl]